ncbi:transferrin-binding protein-like solute binding protein [Spirabiliibacterium falconis]|uniref:transferrin-binding protein-like solute binding protein n=1 Tax=Spirabiliibacterium falconis TaxID=572023 RepID=UPI001AAD24DF|nr:transferrin-binding protein-like solute binding protein [Spirabiliibacterium falconis]MBE2893609.1 hypothetical protein [Spirabiliibacterium falconis]
MLEKKWIKLSLTALAALVLTACGSGGGDSNDSVNSAVNKVEDSAKKVEDKAKEAAKQAEDNAKEAAKKAEEEAKRAEEKAREEAKKAEEAKKLEAAKAEAYAKNSLHGKGFTYVSNYQNPDVKNVQVDSNDLNFITVDGGKILEVIPKNADPVIATGGSEQGEEIPGWRMTSLAMYCCSDKQVSAAIIGKSISPDQRIVTFYNGAPTAESDIPQHGVVKYASQSASLFFVQGGFFTQGKTHIGDTSIVADFDAKKISGWTAAGMIEVEGNISGNSVNGMATVKDISIDSSLIGWDLKTDEDKTAPLNAQFYGENAQSLAGEAHNQKWGVVFAAEKQK